MELILFQNNHFPPCPKVFFSAGSGLSPLHHSHETQGACAGSGVSPARCDCSSAAADQQIAAQVVVATSPGEEGTQNGKLS